MNWLHKLIGEPIFTEDFDGTIRTSRLKKCPDGTLMIKKIIGWARANDNGTVPNGYVKKWWPR